MLFVAYAIFVAFLLSVVALSAEQVFAQLRLPRRSVWIAALAVSFVLPVKAIVMTQAATGSAILSMPIAFSSLSGGMSSALGTETATLTDSPWLRWPEWNGLGKPFIAFWITCSAFLLAGFVLLWLSMYRKIRHLSYSHVEGQKVFLSHRLGPAVFGFIKPRIVLPRWLTDEAGVRALVLRHEREHIAARDPLLLLIALLLAAAMPWNIPMWWQLRRLRAAIEVDCDARVLRKGTDAAIYSEALLYVRQRFSSVPLGAVALGEPVSELERRIRIMMDKAQQFRTSRFLGRLALTASFGFLAFTVNAPAQEQAAARLQPVWPEFLPAVDSYAGSIASHDQGLPVLTLVYDDSGALLGSDYEYFPEIDYPLAAAEPRSESSMNELGRMMEPVAAQAAAVFESYGQPIGEPIFFQSPVDASETLLIWASGDFIEKTMSEKERRQ